MKGITKDCLLYSLSLDYISGHKFHFRGIGQETPVFMK